jgi:hypothetical protein
VAHVPITPLVLPAMQLTTEFFPALLASAKTNTMMTGAINFANPVLITV